MNGTEIMVNTLLKACGFSREQLDEALENAKTKFDEFELRAIQLDERIRRIENNQATILDSLERILRAVESDPEPSEIAGITETQKGN
jgi:hypothetical protein